ncbi:thioredoxin reductase (NADPH) [Desulfonatronum thiosulfatophilum]|uniref:Thioredoxin reductase (NADPH) n=1 Tax=Desulfonatronum thiosulfatophilum TaxID=617002 RepID=A0A1G6AXD7_9BACT|nr:FAD-dependent oxidoreductase [Desulfonatronum thiosulfatophilum]SDB12974.1 thioredoxin reductase (NADPH) [Desulfonatronum thiosulfatophilum]
MAFWKSKKSSADDSRESSEPTQKWLLPEKSRIYLEDLFRVMTRDVVLFVFTREEENVPYNRFCTDFVKDLARISPKIKANFASMESGEAEKYSVHRSPTILVQPEDYRIRFTGAPAGEEGKSLIETILLASLKESGLSETSIKVLAQCKEPRDIQVFVNPVCPYCPQQVMHAIRAAIERPDLISTECVETGQNQDLAQRFNIGAVPHTVVNAEHNIIGLVPEEHFMAEVLTLQPVAPSTASPTPGNSGQEAVDVDLLIVGGGPAGLSAAVYAARSGLKTVILEGKTVGGQIVVTPVVENYPAFTSISGLKLVEMMSEQARQYVQILQGVPVHEAKIGRRVEALTDRGLFRARAMLLATGATWRKLGVPGEAKFFGHGVNYCATCDGYLYKGRNVLVVGGGNTALTDALYLKNLGAGVAVIHRRDAFRGEQHLVDALDREHIPVYWNTVVEEILGEESVRAVRIRDVHSGVQREVSTDGVFVAIGETANADLARDLGLQLNEDGTVFVDHRMRTSHPRIYAAGDVTGGVRQIVTAVGQGSVAALSIFEDLSKEPSND